MTHDAIVVGGSFAGLSAALYIARARRKVCVIDTAKPRNRFAAASHGFFGQDGSKPQTMIAQARDQLLQYPTVQWHSSAAVTGAPQEDGFELHMATGETLAAHKLVLAFGVKDVLPTLPGLSERWGRSVLHCPYCHGFEFADADLGVLYAAEGSIHQALLIAEWGPTTLFLNGHTLPDDTVREKLLSRGIAIEPAPVLRLEGPHTALAAAVLADGRNVALQALFIAAPTRLSSDLAEQLGCAIDDGPFGPMIRTRADKLTTVPNVYAAGDIARAPHSVAWAASDGVMAGTALHRALVFPETGK